MTIAIVMVNAELRRLRPDGRRSRKARKRTRRAWLLKVKAWMAATGQQVLTDADARSLARGGA